ncbi:MAG: triose-phosphate isomerase [Chloroflexi bacterium]|nr:triose-phosphate isomerase [Chloroflexota bacterium]
MRIPMIAGNWKMNTTVSEATELINEIGPGLEEVEGIEKVICPPFVSLCAAGDLVQESTIKLGAQNVFYEEKGAYTGEVSAPMLAELVEYVIIGHSERRQYFHETNEIVNKKVKAAKKAGLKPILCVGETLKEREAGQTKEVVTGQVKESLAGVEKLNGLVIAYEPVWAIGTGKAATGKQANETIGLIRSAISQLYGKDIAQKTRILYGGSVTPANVVEFMKEPEIDGALVGGASLKAIDFLSICTQTASLGK